ncbi:MAG TPA: hypothetical protein VML55_16230 [Planctomycetaceae bacterium]|nr:hypothetical protein [Planctomycetaceae bacterium]
MKTYGWLLCAIACLVAGQRPLVAQDVSGDRPLAPNEGVVVVTDPVQQAREMIEDVEVLRTILEREIGALYGTGGQRANRSAGAAAGLGLPFDPTKLLAEGDSYSMMKSSPMGGGGMPGMAGGMGGPMGRSPMGGRGAAATTSAPPAARPLGAYVEDLGVVYQLELPALREPPPARERADASECTYLSRTEWQRTRQELRGELTVADCRKCHQMADNGYDGASYHHDALAIADCHKCHDPAAMGAFPEGGFPVLRSFSFHGQHARGTSGGPTREELVDRLLSVLAENGRHVRHLAGEERIAIAVSVQPRRPATGGAAGMSPYGGDDFGGDGAGYGGEAGYVPDEGGYDSMDVDGYGESESRGGALPGLGASPMRSSATPTQARSSAGGARSAGPGARGGSVPGGASAPSRAGAGPATGESPGPSPFEAGNDPDSGAPSSPGAKRPTRSGATLGAGRGGPFGRPPGGLTGDAGNDELAGDLHLRQGQAAAAAAAYERALLKAYDLEDHGYDPDGGRTSLASRISPQTPPAERRLFQKLLQAYVAAGNMDDARQLLGKWPDDRAGGTAKRVPRGSESTPAPPLPARLVVSATKVQLDAVASGKLSRDEFAKQALVRWFDPQAPDEQAKTAAEADRVEGVVLNAQREFVEVSLGVDDGTARGAALRIERGGTLIGEAEVVFIARDRSVARIIRKQDVGVEVQRGDRVTPTRKSEEAPGGSATP